MADRALGDLIEWLKNSGGQVGIFDGSNTEESRRKFILEKLSEAKIQPLFLEVICDKQEIIEGNVRQVKISSPDYAHMDSSEAVKDFLKRIEAYVLSYTSISDYNLSFVKLINVGDRIIVNKVSGYLMTRIVYYLMNLHIMNRKIYLVRHGKTDNDLQSRADSKLSSKGINFSKRLSQFMHTLRSRSRLGFAQNSNSPGKSHHLRSSSSSLASSFTHEPKKPQNILKVWSSPRRRSVATAKYFHDLFTSSNCSLEQKWNLVELNTGVTDGLTFEEIEEKFPEDYKLWKKDPYHHRFPRAESYHDLAIRLEEILLELEREKDDVLIIAHESVLKCIYAYLLDKSEHEMINLEIPWETVIELNPVAYGCIEKRYTVDNDLEVASPV